MDEIIQEYIKKFLGYGNRNAYGKPENRFWFVGMEEGGGANRDELTARFNCWHHRGQHQTEDLVGFANEINIPQIMQWFGPQPVRLQSTWKRLIMIYLEAYGREVTDDAIRIFQANCLGRTVVPLPNLCENLSPCLFELMPLPSPRIALWPQHYRDLAIEFPRLAFLNTRHSYRKHVMAGRIHLLQEQIEKYRPKIVCFYGNRRGWITLEQWQQVAMVPLIGQPLLHPNNGLCLGNYWQGVNQTGTSFIVSLHPRTFGLANDYFYALGHKIHGLLQGHNG